MIYNILTIIGGIGGFFIFGGFFIAMFGYLTNTEERQVKYTKKDGRTKTGTKEIIVTEYRQPGIFSSQRYFPYIGMLGFKIMFIGLVLLYSTNYIVKFFNLEAEKKDTVANTSNENKNPDEKKKPEGMIPVEETKMIEIINEAKSKRENIKDIYNVTKYDIEMNEEIASSIKKQFKSNSFNNWIGILEKVENSDTKNSLGFKIKLINSNVKMSNYGVFINDSNKYGIKKTSKLFETISKLPLDSKIKLSGQFVKSELYDYISRDYGIPIILTQIEQINE